MILGIVLGVVLTSAFILGGIIALSWYIVKKITGEKIEWGTSMTTFGPSLNTGSDKAEFIQPDRVSEILKAKPDASVDEVLKS